MRVLISFRKFTTPLAAYAGFKLKTNSNYLHVSPSPCSICQTFIGNFLIDLSWRLAPPFRVVLSGAAREIAFQLLRFLEDCRDTHLFGELIFRQIATVSAKSALSG